MPEIVPVEMLTGALALRSIAGQAATIAGPAIGGLLFAIKPESVYVLGLVLMLVSSALLVRVSRRRPRTPRRRPRDYGGVLAGIRFIATTPILLGAITLDLFAVLFGGAVALLPLFAQSILHVGPFGLGMLRSAPARRCADRRDPSRPQADEEPRRAARCWSPSARSARA